MGSLNPIESRKRDREQKTTQAPQIIGSNLPRNYRVIPRKDRECKDIFSNCKTLSKKHCRKGQFGLWACPEHCNRCGEDLKNKSFMISNSNYDDNPVTQESTAAFILLSQIGKVVEIEQAYEDCNEFQRKTKRGTCVDLDECKLNKHDCGEDQFCENVENGYNCLDEAPVELRVIEKSAGITTESPDTLIAK